MSFRTFAVYITLNYMNPLVRIVVTACSVTSLCVASLAQAKGPFEGSFTEANQHLRLKQVDNRVCGEWSAENQSRSSEGLVAGTVKGGVLTLTWCADQETSCSPTAGDPYSKPSVFIAKKGWIELIHGNGDGSNRKFIRVDNASPKWTNAQPTDNPEFLRSCSW